MKKNMIQTLMVLWIPILLASGFICVKLGLFWLWAIGLCLLGIWRIAIDDEVQAGKYDSYFE